MQADKIISTTEDWKDRTATVHVFSLALQHLWLMSDGSELYEGFSVQLVGSKKLPNTDTQPILRTGIIMEIDVQKNGIRH